MPPVQPDPVSFVDCRIDAFNFLAAIRRIALSKIATEDIKALLASIQVKQNETNADERNVSDTAYSLINGLTKIARESNDLFFFVNQLNYIDTSTPKKRQCDNDENPVEAKRNRTCVNDEPIADSHGDINKENNQPSTSGVREIESKNADDNVTNSVKDNKAKKKHSDHRQSTGSRTAKTYENSPSKGLAIQCVFCQWCRPGIETHYRDMHNITDLGLMLFYDGTALFTRQSSNIDTEGGKATWFVTQRKEAEEKYQDLRFKCRLCDAKLDDRELLEQHYINKSLGHQVDKSKLGIMDTLFKVRPGSYLEVSASNPRKGRKSRSKVGGKESNETQESNDRVAAEQLNAVESPSVTHSGTSVDGQLDSTQVDSHRPIPGSVSIIKTVRDDYPRTATDDHNATHSSVTRNKATVKGPLFRNPLDYISENDFIKKYRLSRAAFEELCAQLRRNTDLRDTELAWLELKVLRALLFFAHGNYRGVTSVYVELLTKALNHPNIIKTYIQFPTTLQEKYTIKQSIFAKYGIPGVIGCIGGRHLKITPEKDGHLYFCKNKYFSMNVQMICDHNCKILSITAKYGGATQDADIWENSNMSDHLQSLHRRNETVWLLGDSGYPQRPWLMTPYPNPTKGFQTTFNRTHNSARALVENTFARLQNRWRCLQADRTIHYGPEKCTKIVMACAVLHNIAIKYNTPDLLF